MLSSNAPFLLLKATVVLSTCWATSVTYTPPNVAPNADEKAGFGKDDFLTRLTQSSWGPLMGNLVPWSIASCELVSILRTLLDSDSSPPALSLSPAVVAGCVLAIGGALGRIACYRALGAQFTFELALKRAHKLVTSGPYRIVRHPAYTAFVTTSVGMLFAQLGPGSWLATHAWPHTTGRAFMCGWAAYVIAINGSLLLRVPKEDAVLRRQFGEEWEEWARRTPYVLIPGIV